MLSGFDLILDHRLGVGGCPDAACGLDADPHAYGLPHQPDVGGSGAGAPVKCWPSPARPAAGRGGEREESTPLFLVIKGISE